MSYVGVPTVPRDSTIASSMIVQDYISRRFRGDKPISRRYVTHLYWVETWSQFDASDCCAWLRRKWARTHTSVSWDQRDRATALGCLTCGEYIPMSTLKATRQQSFALRPVSVGCVFRISRDKAEPHNISRKTIVNIKQSSEKEPLRTSS